MCVQISKNIYVDMCKYIHVYICKLVQSGSRAGVIGGEVQGNRKSYSFRVFVCMHTGQS